MQKVMKFSKISWHISENWSLLVWICAIHMQLGSCNKIVTYWFTFRWSKPQTHKIVKVEHRDNNSVLLQIHSLQPFLSFSFWCSIKLVGLHPVTPHLNCPLTRGSIAHRTEDRGFRFCANKEKEWNNTSHSWLPWASDRVHLKVHGIMVPCYIRTESWGCFTIASHIPAKVWLKEHL